MNFGFQFRFDSVHRSYSGSKVDTFGRHGLSCTKASGTKARHESVNNLIQRALKSAEVPCKSLLWDYTCGDTFALSYVNKTSIELGYVAKQAEKHKYEKYNDLMEMFVFVPVASETSGIFGSVSLKLLKKIGSMITNVTHEKRATSYLLQRIGVAIQRGNVASIMGTTPQSKNLGEIFYL